MAEGMDGLHADALGGIVEYKQPVGREWQQGVGAPASIGEFDLARTAIVEHDDGADVATTQEHGLATLEVRGTRVFEQGHGRVHRWSIIHSLDYRVGRQA